MTGNPLVLAIWLLDLVSVAIYLAAAWRLLAILPHWRPQSNDAGQLERERALPLTVYQGRWVFGLQVIALFCLVTGISNNWVVHIPGAMCGTGVLQALGAPGRQTLMLRVLILLLLYCWHVVVRIDEQRPDALLALTQGRLLLLAAPLLFLSIWRFGQALREVATQGPVSCCAVIYEQASASGLSAMLSLVAPTTWAGACFGGALLLGGWGLFVWRRPWRVTPLAAGLAGGSVLLWVGSAMMQIETTTGAYLLEVLHHPCPWCLFLWERGGLGFALFGLPAFLSAESAAGLAAAIIARCYPSLMAPAMVRIRRSGRFTVLALLAFAILTAAPMLLWHLRFGGWMRL